jgi:hypothetical protein
MYLYQIINSLTDEELSLVAFIVLRNNPTLEVLDINDKMLKSFKPAKIKEAIFKARDSINKDNSEGLNMYNCVCEKFGIQKI